MTNLQVNWFLVSSSLATSPQLAFCEDADEDPYTSKDPSKREPSPCEVCKFFVTELKSRLVETGKNREIIETGHGLEKKKRFSYRTSELRLTEALQDPHVCEKILQYKVHAEREGSRRYAKGISETMSTLHGLRNKGVKVELGIPEEMWDQPSAEVTKMHRACFKLAEDYEELIEDWYFNHQEQDLMSVLCSEKYLPDKKFSAGCLAENAIESTKKGDKADKKKKKKKKAKKNKKGDDGGPSDNTSKETKKKRVKRDGSHVEL
ncbi:Canopy-like protein 3 [Lamellibrachia satsuma]|nr:Canopy-like protein 3 [Lamellibrachia satsuma]